MLQKIFKRTRLPTSHIASTSSQAFLVLRQEQKCRLYDNDGFSSCVVLLFFSGK